MDLTWIDGIDGYTALKVVSEVGTDMTKWENANAPLRSDSARARS